MNIPDSKSTGARRPRRGIYLLPTALTLANLFCGYASLVQSANGALTTAAILIIVAGFLDGLDGRIARLTGATSEFGLQIDSLADIVSFGVAPAFLVYNWALRPYDRLGWVVPFIFLVCAAMRLARFNVHKASGGKKFFAGLPVPMAAGVTACTVFAYPVIPQPVDVVVIVLIVLMVLGVALLMISRFRYRSFKEVDVHNRLSFFYTLPMAIMIVAIALNPRVSLLTIAILYLAMGPVTFLWGLRRKIDRRPQTGAIDGGIDTEVADEPTGR
jgi:CDP-diacylglycerol--serine O-phosphatidyltransferase